MEYLGNYAMLSIFFTMCISGYLFYRAALCERKTFVGAVTPYGFVILFLSPFLVLLIALESQPYRIDIYRK